MYISVFVSTGAQSTGSCDEAQSAAERSYPVSEVSGSGPECQAATAQEQPRGVTSLQYSCLENPMNSMKRKNDRILKEELPRSVGAQYATGDQRRNNSRKNKGMEPKQNQYPIVDVTGDRSKVRCCKEQYCIGS